MSTKKKPGKSVAVAPSRGVVPGGWRERAAKSIVASKQQSAKLPAQSGNFISFRNGLPTLGGVKLPNPIPLVILSHHYERSYYSKPYVNDTIASPDCYSFDGDAPHESAKVPQCDTCDQCRYNEFGSSANGRGKACREGAKFAAIHADALNSTEQIASAAIVQGRLSVMNSKSFRNYTGYFEESGNPIWGSITNLHVTPDPNSQYAVRCENSVADLDDDDLDAIALRVDEADKLLSQPYPDLEAAKPAAPARGAQPARRKKF